MSTQYRTSGRVAVVQLTNPPVNGLGHATRDGIVRDLRRALGDPAVDAVVLTGQNRFFSAGADISEFGTPKAGAEPTLAMVLAALDDADKPVIAAIDGTCFGGGLELALTAHYRVVTAKSQIGLPEVKLGIVPGAGGTQRLPRVLPATLAAQIITDGAPRTAADLAAVEGQRLFDRVVEAGTDVVDAAVAFAGEIAAARPLPRIRDISVDSADLAALTTLKEGLRKRSRGFVAPVAAAELVEKAVTVPFDEGVAAERSTFLELMASEQSASLRYAFFAERTARRIPDIDASVKPRTVETVGVLGAGTMGGGIAMNFLNVGTPVVIVDTTQEALDRGLGVIRKNYQVQVDRGKLAAEELERRMSLLRATTDYADLGTVDLIIEAIFENMSVKREVFTRLDEVAKPGAILATNTSTLDINEIAAVTKRPEDVVGMHFFSPANVMKLLENVRAAATADDVLVTAMEVGRKVGKTCVVAGVCDGFIGNRMLAAYRDAAGDLLRAGAVPAEIDAAIEAFGFAMGPFKVGDLAGNDISYAIRQRRYAEHPDSPRDEVADAVVELGRLGQKTGAGWYDYDGRTPKPSPVVEQILEDWRQKHGITRTTFAPEEIAQRLVFALTDSGARILEEGIALRASDIDVVYLSGYGFPRHRGGPMRYADTVGLPKVLEALRSFHGPEWEPAPLLKRLADEGGSFTK